MRRKDYLVLLLLVLLGAVVGLVVYDRVLQIIWVVFGFALLMWAFESRRKAKDLLLLCALLALALFLRLRVFPEHRNIVLPDIKIEAQPVDTGFRKA